MKEYLKSRSHEELVSMLYNIYKALDVFYPDLTPEEELKVKMDLIGLEFPYGAYISSQMDNELMMAKATAICLTHEEFLVLNKQQGNIDQHGRPTSKGVQSGLFNRKQDHVVLLFIGDVYKTFKVRFNNSFLIIHQDDGRDNNQVRKIGLDSLATWLGFSDGHSLMQSPKIHKTIKEIHSKTGVHPLRVETINNISDNFFDLSLWVETFGEFNVELWAIAS